MRKTQLIITLCFAFALLLSCNNNEQGNKRVSDDNSPNGLWRQIGYGRILELNDSTIKVFDLNDSHCMLTFEEDILDFAQILKVTGDTLTLKHGIDHWKCLKIEALPAKCTNPQPENLEDPLLNYDVFWQNFKEHYCSFELKNIDWDDVNKKYRPKVNAQTTDLALYLIFEEMIALLQDGHIDMPLPDSLEDEYKSTSTKAPRKYNMFDVFETAESLALNYVDSLRIFNAGMSHWGMVGQHIGYVQINAMFMQADYNLEPGLSLMELQKPYWEDNASKRKDEIQRQDEASGMGATLDRVIADMPDATTYIVDIRFNTGGKDGVAMEIVNHFSSFQGKMASKYVHEKGLFVNRQDITNTPSPNGFHGPVYLLTSHLTASAAELVVLCSLADKNFTRIGSRTEGVFSSTLDKVLPNGWEYMFSNEVYNDLNGVNYEHVGISPDINIGYSQDRDEFIGNLKIDLKAGSDPAMESALGIIKSR